MTRKTQRRTDHWSKQAYPVEPASPYTDAAKTAREPRVAKTAGLGPYESQYDIALGYSQDRSILLP